MDRIVKRTSPTECTRINTIETLTYTNRILKRHGLTERELAILDELENLQEPEEYIDLESFYLGEDYEQRKVKKVSKDTIKNNALKALSLYPFPTLYTNDGGQNITAYMVALSCSTNSYTAKRLKAVNLSLYMDNFLDLLQESLTALLTVPQGEDKAYYYKIGNQAIDKYVARNEAFSVDTAVMQGIRELRKEMDCSYNTAKGKYLSTIDTTYLDTRQSSAISWEQAEALAYEGNQYGDEYTRIQAKLKARGLSDGDIITLTKVLDNNMSFYELRKNARRKYQRIAEAVKLAYPNGLRDLAPIATMDTTIGTATNNILD